jgi:hypothetical protein
MVIGLGIGVFCPDAGTARVNKIEMITAIFSFEFQVFICDSPVLLNFCQDGGWGDQADSMSKTPTEEKLNLFDVVALNPNRNGSAEQLHRQNQTLIRAVAYKNSLKSIKRSSSNTHAFAGREERVNPKRSLFSYRHLETLDFFVRDRSTHSLAAHEPKHTWRSQYS